MIDFTNFARRASPSSRNGDGISDFDEVNFDGDPDYNPLLDLDPLDTDTDGDGFSDGEELAAGSDPLDPASVPPPQVPSLTATGYLLLVGALILGSLGSLARPRRG